jgi:hypothetical protein
MSRSCNDCDLDGNCAFQKNGTVSCSRGSEKTYEQRIKDIDDGALLVINMLESIARVYASWDLWDKVKIIDESLNILKNGYENELIEKYVKQKKGC